MSDRYTILPLTAHPDTIAALANLLIETVAHRGSIGFMHPVTPAKAITFWKRALTAAGRGSRIVLGAYDGEQLVGTVTLLLDCPENQPHRGEIAKMMTSVAHRGRGVAGALLREAERIAVEKGRPCWSWIRPNGKAQPVCTKRWATGERASSRTTP